jgi:hypothetical protein
MIPLEAVIALLRRLEALSWPAQVVGLALILAGYALLLFIAWRMGGRNSADLEDENTALERQVAESDAKRRELRDEESKLGEAVRSLQAQRPEERLARAAKERQHGNEELAIPSFTTGGPAPPSGSASAAAAPRPMMAALGLRSTPTAVYSNLSSIKTCAHARESRAIDAGTVHTRADRGGGPLRLRSVPKDRANPDAVRVRARGRLSQPWVAKQLEFPLGAINRTLWLSVSAGCRSRRGSSPSEAAGTT